MQMPLLKKLELKYKNLKAQFPKGQVSGEDITINDSSNLEFDKFIVTGNSYQETRQGYNFLNVPDEFTITGTSNPNKSVAIVMPIGDYTVKANQIESDKATNILIIAYYTDDSGSQNILIDINNPKTTFNLGKEVDRVVIYASNTMANSKETITTFKQLMIYAGTEDKPYELYGVMPSIDYPSEIRNCGDNINLFNEKFRQGSYNATLNSRLYSTQDIQLPLGEYILSSNLDENIYDLAIDLLTELPAVENADNQILKTYGWASPKVRTFTIEKSGYLGIALRHISAGNIRPTEITSNIWFKLEKGKVTTSYSPYKCGNVNFKITNEADEEQTISFPMKEGQVLHKGDYLADDGIHYRRKTIELDETETIRLDNYSVNNVNTLHFNTTNYSDMKIAENYVSNPNYASNLFKTPTVTWGADEEQIAQMGTKVFNIAINRDRLETQDVDGFKKFLTEQKAKGIPLKIEYELETEIIEPYSAEQKEVYKQLRNLHTYKGTTHIFSIDEVSPIFEVEYTKDLEVILKGIKQ